MKYTYEQPEYLDIDGARHLVQELKVYIQEILNGNIDITQYATKEELSNAVSSIDLTDYAKTSDIPSLDGYATKSYVDENIANVTTGGEVDLSNYVTKDTVYTKAETNALIPSTEGLATKGYVDNAVSNIPTTDLTGYATEEYVSTAINSIPATDLSNYYTKSETYSKTEVDTLVANSGGGSSSGGITYAFDTEIATGETWVDGKPIYMKVLDFTNVKPSSSSGYNLYMVGYDDWLINEVIDSRIAFRNGQSNYTTENPYQGTIPSTTNIKTVINDINSYVLTRGIYHNVITSENRTTIQVFIGTWYNNATKKIYLTVKYTKP